MTIKEIVGLLKDVILLSRRVKKFISHHRLYTIHFNSFRRAVRQKYRSWSML